MRYKKEYSFEQRKLEAVRIRRNYPDRIPVILERNPQSQMGALKRKKYLVPCDLTVRQFHHLVWKQSESKGGIWFFVHDTIPPTSVTMGCLYEEHRDDDFFLYISYADENVFGHQL